MMYTCYVYIDHGYRLQEWEFYHHGIWDPFDDSLREDVEFDIYVGY